MSGGLDGTSGDGSSGDGGRESSTQRARSSRPWLGFFAGAGIACLIGGLVIYLQRDRTPILTRERLDAAYDRWRQNAVDDYDVRLLRRADGLDDERVEISVRNGAVTQLSLNGTASNRPSSAYSIDGLFDIMRRELVMALEKTTAGARHGSLVKAAFDDATGAPVTLNVLAGEGRSFFIEVEELTAAPPR